MYIVGQGLLYPHHLIEGTGVVLRQCLISPLLYDMTLVQDVDPISVSDGLDFMCNNYHKRHFQAIDSRLNFSFVASVES
jgi:hypothetical protein